MSPVAPGVGRREVKISRPRNSSRKKTCEILRNSGNLERANDLLYTPRARGRYLSKENDCRSGKPRAVICVTDFRLGAAGWDGGRQKNDAIGLEVKNLF